MLANMMFFWLRLKICEFEQRNCTIEKANLNKELVMIFYKELSGNSRGTTSANGLHLIQKDWRHEQMQMENGLIRSFFPSITTRNIHLSLLLTYEFWQRLPVQRLFGILLPFAYRIPAARHDSARILLNNSWGLEARMSCKIITGANGDLIWKLRLHGIPLSQRISTFWHQKMVNSVAKN